MIRLKGFQKLTSVDDALRKFSAHVKIRRPNTVVVPLASALNRILAERVLAEVDVPRSERSAVDGYAVEAEETSGATQFKPQAFRLTEKNWIGARKARQVWTGNRLPEGSNAVVMFENTQRLRGVVHVWGQVTPGENVSKKGEDIQKGEVAAGAGVRLKPQHLGLLAALGMAEVKVCERPKIGVLATGNELVEPGEKPGENQIFDTNKPALSALCRELGAEPLDLGIVKDDVNEISESLRRGLEKSDLIVTSGGTSVGGSDLVPDAVDGIGKPGVIVHGVAMRPGMPTALAAVEGKPILILPGNPVAAMFGFEVFGRPLVCRILGLKRVEFRPAVQATMTRGISTPLGRRSFVRVRVFRDKGELQAEPVSARGSSMISTMTRANGYVIVPENREGLLENESVYVRLFDSVEV